MTNVLVRFVYRNGTFMDDGIYDAIEFTANPIINQPNRNQCTSTVTQTITAAIKAHVAVTHRLTAVNVDVQTAHFVWKDGGRGSNLMKMDEEKARNQVALARDRGCVDHIHIEFTTRDSFRTRASRASRAPGGEALKDMKEVKEVKEARKNCEGRTCRELMSLGEVRRSGQGIRGGGIQ